MLLTAEVVLCRATATVYRCPPREKGIRGFPSALVTASCRVDQLGLTVKLSFRETAIGRLRDWESTYTRNLRQAFWAMLILDSAREVSSRLPTVVLTRTSSDQRHREVLADLVGGTDKLQEIFRIDPPEIEQALAFSRQCGSHLVFDSAYNPLAGLTNEDRRRLVMLAMQSNLGDDKKPEPAQPTFAWNQMTASIVRRG